MKGLQFDETSTLVFGQKDGYTFYIEQMNKKINTVFVTW